MSFIELAKERYSVRSFDSKKVEKEKLDLILKAAQIAPTAANRQPQRILVIESKEAVEKLESNIIFHFNAPMALIVCADKDTVWQRKCDNKTTADIDASIVATHMMLQATELGLGTTWIGHFDPTAIVDAFNIPSNLEPICILPLGYPSKDAKPHTFHTEKKEISETVFFNHF